MFEVHYCCGCLLFIMRPIRFYCEFSFTKGRLAPPTIRNPAPGLASMVTPRLLYPSSASFEVPSIGFSALSSNGLLVGVAM